LDLLQQVLNDGAKSRLGGQLGGDAEAAIQGQSRFYQRGQFLAEKEDVLLADTLKVDALSLRFGRGLLDGKRNQPHALNSQRDGALIRSFNSTLSEAALTVHSLVGKLAHSAECIFHTSCVTRSTSSGVVIPRLTLVQPSYLRLLMPDRSAVSRKTFASG